MSAHSKSLGETVWDLPPLILHPFNEQVSPSSLLENSKAALMLTGLIPGDGSDDAELKRRLLAGRYSEIRMLYYLGKDVFRWIEQCMDWTRRVPELADAGIEPQSFAALLTVQPPAVVKDKLVRWGVADHVSIFSRSIGLNVLFANPPEFQLLGEEFLRNYHRHSDAIYRCYLEGEPYLPITGQNFAFLLYASGEYSRLLEAEWEQG